MPATASAEAIKAANEAKRREYKGMRPKKDDPQAVAEVPSSPLVRFEDDGHEYTVDARRVYQLKERPAMFPGDVALLEFSGDACGSISYSSGAEEGAEADANAAMRALADKFRAVMVRHP